MKIFGLLLLSICIFTSCNNCDCSYENFAKINKSKTKESVEKILKTKPSAIMYFDYSYVSKYSCGENYIIVDYDSDNEVEYALFNTKYKWMTFDE